MLKDLKKVIPSTDSLMSLLLGLAVVIAVGLLLVRYFSDRQVGSNKVETKPEELNQAGKLPTTYLVSAGDTLWSIAEKYYQSGYNWVDIQKTNNLINPDNLVIGQQLTIPDVKAIVVGQISAAQTTMLKPKDEKYTAVKGDTLWDIAVKEYGDGFQWTKIAESNHLVNPELIHAGNVFILPTIP